MKKLSTTLATCFSVIALLAISFPMNAQVTVGASATANVTCNGGSNGAALATVSVGTSPYTYLWSDANSQTTAMATGLSAGTYTVTVTDSTNTSGTASVIITQPFGLGGLAITGSNVICRNSATGSASSTISGGTIPYTYLWTGGAGSNANASGLSAGRYTLTVTDACGSSQTTSITITQPARLRAVTNTTSVTCTGGDNGSATITTTGGTAPYTYSWSSGGTTNKQTGLTAGKYTVIISDSCGGSTTANITVRAPFAITAFGLALTNVTCAGGDNGSVRAIVFGGTSPYTYSWTPTGGTRDTAKQLTAGTYTVTVKDSCGNSATATAVVTQASALIVTTRSVHDSTGVTNCSGVASVIVSGGTAPYTYVWLTTSLQTTASISKQCAGTYCCGISDANGCTQSACVTISNVTGINNISNSQSIKVYPDPTTGYFTIQSSAVNDQASVIEIYNMLGQQVYTQRATLNSALSIDIAAQPNGIYLIRILNIDGTLVTEQKIIKTQ